VRNLISKMILPAMVIGVFALFLPASAYAHVTVKPAEVLSGEYQTFTTSVPNEKDVAVTAIKLVIPTDITLVTPTVKQGWKIDTKKTSETVTEINWSGGTIDAGLRDEFTFSAKVPANKGEIVWKAYQSYQDGSIVAWDQKPAGDHSHATEDETKGPYSVTTVSDEDVTEKETTPESNVSNMLAFIVSGVAVIVSLIAIGRTIKR